MFDRFDPRDRDDDRRDGHDIYDPRWDNDPRDRHEDCREAGPGSGPARPVCGRPRPAARPRARDCVGRERPHLRANSEDSRTLATVGAFRVVSESDLRDPREGGSTRATTTIDTCEIKG